MEKASLLTCFATAALFSLHFLAATAATNDANAPASLTSVLPSDNASAEMVHETHDRILFQPGLLVRLQCGNFRRHQHRRFLDQDFPQRLQKRPSRIQSRLQSAQTDRSTQQTPFVALYDDGRQRDDLLFQLKMGILFGNETKKCPECGMIIPSEARKCPYCRTEFGEPSLSDDLNRFGCLGYPSVILTILLLLHTCS